MVSVSFKKIPFAKLCNPIHNAITVSVSFDHLNVETEFRIGKNFKRIEHPNVFLKKELDIKSIFHGFPNAFF